jgi:transposase
MLESIGLALAGRAGARLAGALGLPTSRSALLRLIRALPDPEIGRVRVLGVDDFALRRGHIYGTVLIDMATHRPIDVLADREADTFTAWLLAHPGAEVICRDRAGAYAEAAGTGAPDAIQVADRWHLWHNLAEVVERIVARLRVSWRPPEPVVVRAEAIVPDRPDGPGALRIRERHAAVHALMDKGASRAGIARELRIDSKTARRFMAAATAEDLIESARLRRGSTLDAHASYLTRRWAEGCTSTSRLHQELRERGVPVSERTVRRFLLQLRQDDAPPKRPVVPKVKQVARAVLTHPEALTEADAIMLKELRDRCEDLALTCQIVESFAKILINRGGEEKLTAWVQEVEAGDLSEMQSFAAGLRRDWAAVCAGITLPWSSGKVEGHVNRIKMLKRQMFGRAKPDLLRKRVLLAN